MTVSQLTKRLFCIQHPALAQVKAYMLPGILLVQSKGGLPKVVFSLCSSGVSAEKQTIERLIGNTDFDLVHAVLSQIDGGAQMEAENSNFNLGALIMALPSLQVFDARFARYVFFTCSHTLLLEGC
jgi:hypothetical protein